MRKLGGVLFASVAFGICAWYLATRVDWNAGMAVLADANPYQLLGGGCAAIVAYFLTRAVRWRLIVNDRSGASAFVATYMITAIGIGLALVTPGQIGEAVKIELLKRHAQLDRWSGAAGLLIERGVDMIIVGAIALAGFVTLGSVSAAGWRIAVLLLVVAVVAMAVAVTLGRNRLTARFGRLVQPFAVLRGRLPQVFAISLVGWFVVALGWQAALASVGIGLGLLKTLWLVAVVIIAVVASMIPGGLGASEVVVVEVLRGFGFDSAQALAGALILRIYGVLVIAVALLHLAAWTWQGNRLRAHPFRPAPPEASVAAGDARSGS